TRLVRQLLTETLVLALLGGAAGVLAAQAGGSILGSLFLPADASTSVVADRRTLLVTIVATIGAALLTGIAPVSHALRYRLASTLSGAGRRAGESRPRARMLLLLLQATL